MHTLMPAAVSASFTDGLAATIFILAVYGLFNLFGLADRKSYWRLGVIILIAGVLFANLAPVRAIGDGLRNLVDKLLVAVHLEELSSDLVLTIIVALIILGLWGKHQKVKDSDNKYMWFTLVGVVVLLTTGLVSKGVLFVSTHAAEALGWLQNLNF